MLGLELRGRLRSTCCEQVSPADSGARVPESRTKIKFQSRHQLSDPHLTDQEAGSERKGHGQGPGGLTSTTSLN